MLSTYHTDMDNMFVRACIYHKIFFVCMTEVSVIRVFEDKGEKFHFTEKVRAYTLEDFQTMMNETGIYLLDTFGDYKLKKFHKNTSERLIMIFK